MEKRISTLIFCKDGIENVVNLINEIYGISEEIIVIDSSTPKNKEILAEEKNKENMEKVHIYPVTALGHPEPYQMYGLSKCNYEWVFYIDTDERPNEYLKRDIKEIISTSKCDAFLVRKMERDRKGNVLFSSYQRRLYKKDKATYTGNVFFDPIIEGTENNLNDNYFINHHFDYYENPDKSNKRYFLICAYETRKTYRDIIEFSLDSKFICNFIEIYYRKFGKKVEDELSNFDYKLLHIFYEYVFGEFRYCLKKRKLPNFGFMINNIPYLIKETESLFNYDDNERKLQLAISKEIHKSGGVINYLNMDEILIKQLRAKDCNNLNGVDLFISLLRDKYYKNHESIIKIIDQ